MALFGRDSLITSYQALPFLPELAATTLRCSPRARARRCDDFRDEEPGKILHELALRRADRASGSARTRRTTAPRTRRRCSWCCSTSTSAGPATPTLVRALEPQRPRGARRGSTTHGDLRRRRLRRVRAPQPETGLENQCWKDSLELDPVRRRHARRGRRSRPARSRATSTTRKRRAARLAREVWGDPALAERLDAQADDAARPLPRATSGCPERGYYALALDGDKRQVDSAHLEHRPPALERHRRRRRGRARSSDHLLGDAAVLRLGRAHDGRTATAATTRSATTTAPSGRTTTRSSPPGSRRYGYREEAGTIASRDPRGGRTYFDDRLPEVFAGYRAERHAVPGRVSDRVAARRPGPPARRCCCCESCSGSKPEDGAIRRDPVFAAPIGELALDGPVRAA